MAQIKLTGLNPGWHVHIHAGELDAEADVDNNGEIVFEVNDKFHAVMATAVMWKDADEATEEDPGSGAGGLALPLRIDAGDNIELGA